MRFIRCMEKNDVYELTPTNDDDRLTFVALAAATANVVAWLQIQMIEDFDSDGRERGRNDEDQQQEEQRRVHRSAHVRDDDDCEDRRKKAERENDSDAGRQVVTRRARLKPFACLSV